MSLLYDRTKLLVGKRVKYRGTNGNEYSSDHGKPLEGVGKLLDYHTSHGFCIDILTDAGEELCVDHTEIEEMFEDFA